MEIKNQRCEYCGEIKPIIPSNNPLNVGSLCEDCISQRIDKNNLDHFAFFCRTYNLPVNVDLYLGLLGQNPNIALTQYVKALFINGELSYSDEMTDQWKSVSKEWEKVKTHQQLLEKVRTFRDDFESRALTKWGSEYSFEELMMLENLFNNIVKNLAMTNPTQLDTVKKYCKMSLLVDQMISGGEMKQIADATAALQKLASLAQIQELSETATEGTIKTVADLYKYFEDRGFRFQYYNNEDQDIVDKTIHDIQQSLRNEVVNAIGFDVLFQDMKERFYKQEEELVEDKATEEIKLEDIVKSLEQDETANEFEEQLQAEDVIFEDEEE